MSYHYKNIQISLNLKKFIFCTPIGITSRHVVCEECLLVDLAKIAFIVNMLAPTHVKGVSTKMGHTGYFIENSQGTMLVSRRH